MTARTPDAVKARTGKLERSRTAAGRAAKASAPGVESRGKLWIIPAECDDPGASPSWQDCWRELAAAVNSNRTATAADRPLFGELVRALHLSRRFADELEKDGATYTSSSGAVKAHPATSGWVQASKVFASLAARFGCAPADRDRALDLGSNQWGACPEDEFAQLLEA